VRSFRFGFEDGNLGEAEGALASELFDRAEEDLGLVIVIHASSC